MKCIKKWELYWNKSILYTSILFQIIFFVELIFLYQFILVDPGVHEISYENWKWFILEWTPPDYWNMHFNFILTTAKTMNRVFGVVFGILIIYIWKKGKKFALKRKNILITVFCLIVASILIHFYIRYNVDLYRLYMYAIPNEMLALYLLYCYKRMDKT